LSTLEKERLTVIRLSDLTRDVSAFLIDRRARGLSPRTVDFYREELAKLAAFVKELGITETTTVTATHLHTFLLHLAERRNPGGVHAG
jgi:site-specific recombinase XerC